MACPSYPSQISLFDIFLEHTRNGQVVDVKLSNYYAGGQYVSSGTRGYPGGASTNIPSQGQISLENFHGSEKILGYDIFAIVVGGGGAGGGGRRDRSGGAGAGGGGGGYRNISLFIPTSRSSFSSDITVGGGGSAPGAEATPGGSGGTSFLKISTVSGMPAASLPNGLGYQIVCGGGGGGGANSGGGGAGGYSPSGPGAGGGGYASAGGSGSGAGGGGGAADDRTHGQYNRGGDGQYSFATGETYSGGGGGGGDGGDGGHNGGAGGGGSGKSSAAGQPGTPGLGGGGGGGASWDNDSWAPGGSGGSGAVIIYYPSQYGKIMSGGTEEGGPGFLYYIHKFKTVGGSQSISFI